MDHVFGMLEQYANKLEEEVQERTRELDMEKKKSDILLYRMLPRYLTLQLLYDGITIHLLNIQPSGGPPQDGPVAGARAL